MIIALTGGTGFVGQAVFDQAARQGVSIRALARREMALRDGVEWVLGDLADKDALAALMRGADAVLHVAGVVNAPDPAGFHAGNVSGTEGVIAAARDAGVRRFVFVSSLAAREPRLSAYGTSKLHAEEAVQTSGLDWSIVRPPAIYGPRDRDMLELFRMARWRVVPMPPKGRTSIIHVDDLARLLLAFVPANPALSERLFEPDDGREGGWPHAKLGDAIGRGVGRNVLVPHVPKVLLQGLAVCDRMVRGKNARLTMDRVSYMTHRDWVSRRDKAPPGDVWAPQIATRDGMRATARWYREEGWL
ncbi:MAG: NAD(P)H-binding protein [Croceibacterium sp.]